MATTGPKKAKPNPDPTKKAEGDNLWDTRLQPELQTHLGRNLKAFYQAVVEEPVPERLLSLLDELKRKETKSS